MTDSVGSADGTVVDTTLDGSGKVELGVGPYVDFANDVLGGITNMTTEVWVERGDLSDRFQRIFDFGDSGTGPCTFRRRTARSRGQPTVRRPVPSPTPSTFPRCRSPSFTASPHRLSQNPIHLGLRATAEVETAISGMEWYQGYAARRRSDGNEARLVAEFTFSESWSSWEMHPNGAEVVLCTAGSMTLIQEIDGEPVKTELRPGEYAINAPGVWHTADVEERATALFITAGSGTQHRPRS